VLARICASDPNGAKSFVVCVVSFTGTNTSEPGPVWARSRQE
jgi:hypothetical protein